MSQVENSWKDRAAGGLLQAFAPPLAQMDRGQGCYLWDSAGKRYLDFLGGIAVNSLGHCHPAFVAALSDQARRLDHISNVFVSRPQLDLAERLLRLADAPGGKVFFANSGAEVNEAAWKLARLHGNKLGKKRILAFEGAFHGRTMGALALTAKEQFREPFAPGLEGVEHVPLTVSALEAAMDDNVAAVFLEPIQGEAGVVELPEGLLAKARELTSRHGALLILDEIQTGAGRTGKWFAYQHSGVVPDAITLAKGLGGGFPIGALVTFPSCPDLFYAGSHGTTFGGNPLAAAVAGRVLEVIESEAILENVELQSGRLREGILSLESDFVAGVRGAGLLLGIELAPHAPAAADIVGAAFEKGLIANAPHPGVIRIAPPLIVGGAQVEEFLEILGETLASF